MMQSVKFVRFMLRGLSLTSAAALVSALAHAQTRVDLRTQSKDGPVGGGPCTSTALSVQYNAAGSFGCLPDFTFSAPHTIVAGASGIFDMHFMSAAGLTLPGALSTGILKVATTTGAISSVSAPAGVVVGTTDTQTLTNKTVDGVTPTVFGYLDATSSIQTQLNGKGAGSVTQVTFPAVPSWLTATVATNTTTPAISLSLTAAQTPHRVIGTCGTATSFSPCSLIAGDLPSIPLSTGVTGNLSVSNLNGGTGASSSTFWRGDGTWAIAAGATGGFVNPMTSQGDIIVENSAPALQGLQLGLRIRYLVPTVLSQHGLAILVYQEGWPRA